MLSKTKLGEDIPGGSPSESVPTSDELDHGALIADPARSYGLVEVTGAPPSRAGIACCSIVASLFSERNRRNPARLSGKTVGWTIRFTVSAPMFQRADDGRNPGEPECNVLSSTTATSGNDA